MFHPYVCPYIRTVQSCLVQMQPEVRLVGLVALILGARRFLIIPCPPTGAAQVSVVGVGIAVR
jgi:hypothetical protein